MLDDARGQAGGRGPDEDGMMDGHSRRGGPGRGWSCAAEDMSCFKVFDDQRGRHDLHEDEDEGEGEGEGEDEDEDEDEG